MDGHTAFSILVVQARTASFSASALTFSRNVPYEKSRIARSLSDGWQGRTLLKGRWHAHIAGNSITSASASALENHVRKLAEEIGPRHILRPEPSRRRDYIGDQWRAEGYVVETQEYTVRDILCMNVIVTLPGIALPDQVVLAGAHYDTVPRSPGADDNASGVAGLLELGRRLSACRPRRTIRLVAFVNEEPPFFYWSQMGSARYARAARQRGEDIRGMFSLEMLGYLRITVEASDIRPSWAADGRIVETSLPS